MTSAQWVIASALLALFLGALDALVVGAAMPTIVAELGGLKLYSWVFSAYLLTRTIALPIFGKLCDLFDSRRLFTIAVSIFVGASVLSGSSESMTQLIVFRAFQGIGAGANFALSYYVVAHVSAPEKRGKMMGLVSFVWGVSSLLGPGLGGYIVDYLSWRWIFYINVPLGLLALAGIRFYMDGRPKTERAPKIDYLGAGALSVSVFSLLAVFLLAGETYAWRSPQILGFGVLALLAGWGFVLTEKRAENPILPLASFRNPRFVLGNAVAFGASFAIFSLSAFFPLFIQGVLGKTPSQLGLAMIPLSLGWSAGAWIYGQFSQRIPKTYATTTGCLFMLTASLAALRLERTVSMTACSSILALAGLGMGLVSIATLLVVQESQSEKDLGIATASHQFSRTLGGTIGIGISGSVLALSISKNMENFRSVPGMEHMNSLGELRRLFRPQLHEMLPPDTREALQTLIASGLENIFWVTLAASLTALGLSLILGRKGFPQIGLRS